MKDQKKASLIVNWIGRQCAMTLNYMGITNDKPDAVFKALESILRPVSNQTLNRFKSHAMKQKKQTHDAYMSKLCLSVVGCKYPNAIQEQLLKDQYIFGICIKEIQDHFLGGIKPDDTSDKCFLDLEK